MIPANELLCVLAGIFLLLHFKKAWREEGVAALATFAQGAAVLTDAEEGNVWFVLGILFTVAILWVIALFEQKKSRSFY